MLALAPTGRAKGCSLQIAKAATPILKLRSDHRSERSKSDASGVNKTSVTSLLSVRTRFYCSTVPKKKEKLPLSITHPELAKEAEGWDPTIYSSSAVYKTWLCANDHKYNARIYDRKRGRGCNICSGKVIVIGINDLKTTHPEIASLAFEWDPRTVSAGSHKKVKWKCKNEHVTEAVIKNRTQLGNECSICANQEVLIGFNDLATNYPELAKEAYGWDPKKVISGSNIDLEWKCPLGHIYTNNPGARTRGQGCNICAGKKILVGFNDLATTHPEIAKEAYGWDPQKVFGGTHSKKTFKCSLGHKYSATVKDRTSSTSGCPNCAKTGFNPSLDGYLYFLEHPLWQMNQIGITNFPEKRIQNHKNLGWQLLEVRGPIDGYLTQQWERAILRMLKGKGADLSNNKIAGKFDGYSEAWSKSSFPVKYIKELMQLTEEFEQLTQE